ncbi:unnamed protein product [Thelazia callipaeda]|uniref:Galactose oxidase n=1 Tax=Thelazia callipaeda TaxID=103827 RepID=A0A0N5DAR1_THECL|nr:unnamed protein product [Thelazia callipaeda]
MVYWTVSVGGGPKLNRAAAAVGDIIYSFGVYGNSLHDGSLRNQITVYALDTSSYLPLFVDGMVPDGRINHTAVIFNDEMVVYGGKTNLRGRLPRETYAYNFKQRKWRLLRINVRFQGDVPVGRVFHTSCVIGTKMYVFGGISNDLRDQSMMILNLEKNQWERPQERGDIPIRRSNHCAWVYKNKMYIYGGFQNTDDQQMGIVHEFDPETSSWRKLKPCGFNGPGERHRHGAVVVNNRLFLFAGIA